MKLVIVESPGKISTISKILGDEFKVIASYGHIVEIPPKGINIDLESGSFNPTIRFMKEKNDVIRMIRSASEMSELVYLCTDSDREGERIAFDLAFLVKDKSKIRRAAFHEITKKAVLNAINNTREIDMDLVNSQFARQILDRMIGYLVSPLLWRSVPGGKSAGRVQSAALKLVADRESEIEAFDVDQFWDISVCFDYGNNVICGITRTEEKGNRFIDKDKAKEVESIIKNSNPVVKGMKRKRISKIPSPPFDTASMQKYMSTKHGWSGKKTMEVAQKLYEGGFCTYHRTDSFAVSDEAYKIFTEHISSNIGEGYVPKERRSFKKKTKSQEAHECIRPTAIFSGDWVKESLGSEEQKLFEAIYNRFMASQMSNMTYDKTIGIVECDSCEVIIEGKVIVFDGWTKIWGIDGKETLLPAISRGEKLDVNDVIIREHKTRAPDRYNDGSLVSKMEKEGVGRPSTWASLLDQMEKRGYVTKGNNKFNLTSLGRRVSNFLIKKFDTSFMNIDFTSRVESELDKVSNGEADKTNVIKEFYSSFKDIVYRENNATWVGSFNQK